MNSNPQRWTGLLRRNAFARAIQGSNSIEGYHATDDDAVAVVEDEEPVDANRETWLALSGYRNALTYNLLEVFISGDYALDVLDLSGRLAGRDRPAAEPSAVARRDGEVLPPETPVEQLARHLHWTMLRLDLTDDDEWEQLTDASKEFYRACVRELLLRRDILLAALE